MADTLTSARFFFGSDVHSWLFNKFDSIEEIAFFDSCSFGYDIIDQPFYCAVSSDKDYIDIKIYIRSELGAYLENPDFGVAFSTKGDKPKVTANTGRLGGDPGEMIVLFYKAAVILGAQIAEKGLVDEYADMDTEEEGVVVSLNGDELSFEHVCGADRPAMACTTLFDGVQMMRPYQNEIMDGLMGELLSLEEKIELAEAGDEEMMGQLAITYLNGDDEVEADPEKAVYWFNKLAELDHSDAQFNLGLHCAKGYGIKRDFAKAAYWMQRAADNGDEDAPALVEKYTKAAEAIEKIDSGDAQAQADLAGVLMALANSLEQAGTDNDDYVSAFDLAQKSADQNNGDGIWILALAYEHGRGVEANVDIAVELYKRGAELGHAPSQHSLACYYFRGDFLKRNSKKAFELCMKSAEQGYGLAMADIGRCYQFGNGVMGNMKTALEWYEKALEVIDDPELERKVAIFKLISEKDEHWDEDYPGTDDDDFEKEDSGCGESECERQDWTADYPMIKAIQGTGYEGRTARIEYVKAGDELLLKADYNNSYYSPVAIEVFNDKNETLGYLSDGFGAESLAEIAKHLDTVKAKVASVTPLSQRTKRAKYALMDIELYI